MNIYIWRHSKKLTSWSMLNEPHIYRENYMRAEVVVLAEHMQQALDLLQAEGCWNMDELMRIEPIVVPLDDPGIVTRVIEYM